MTKQRWIFLLTVCSVIMASMAFGPGLGCAETKKHPGGFQLGYTSYAGTGGGIARVSGESVPVMDAAAGFQLKPWLALGAFLSGSPLSNFSDADFGLTAADQPNAYNWSTGTEVLLTPWAQKPVHPLVRMTLGGISAGYGVDLNGEPHSLEQVVEERFFAASLSGGLEFRLSRHLRLAGTAGWRFAGNDEILGIEEGGLSGFTAGISARILWETVIR